MSFGSLLDGGGGGVQYPYAAAAGPGVFASSPALSLGLADGGVGRAMGSAVHGGGGKDASEADNESRSASDHPDVFSAAGGDVDEDDADAGNPRKRKKRYHRHTPHQIQQLEALFKESPHPDDKQRADLGRRLGLEPRQVKFWFQNRRTQMKTQLERHENALLKQENDKLRAENLSIREAMRNPVCGSCGGPATMLGDLSLEEHHLRVENARLRDELTRVCALTAKFIGKPVSLLALPPPPHMHQPHHDQYLPASMSCRRQPSGCIVQDTPNGLCKVTWVEHTEYDEASVHQLYRPLLQSGLAFGAGRWLATLQRQCECLAILMSAITVPEHDSAAVTLEGKRSMLKLARRMMENFCAGVSASSAREWSKLDGLTGSIGADVRVMVRKSVDEPGMPPGVVLSAATSVWIPVMAERLFNFLRNEELRAEWDILSNGGPMQQVVRIAKGQLDGNSVTLLRAAPTSTNQNSMLILQETCTDESGAMVVYAPVDIPAMQLVMGGGDSTYVALLPSGFAILPGGPSISGCGHKASGSLLTVAFQILVNSQPTAKLTAESVDTVNNLIACTIKKIMAALHCDA
ncbi:hypothetical protein EJB05_39646 [Eragrostis curvula]|uniref:Homeobox domain-containing protein n=1 Tax=Eragrostis curvula TaxID=38414 RepID=A0A5J9TY47_9POAL|nr:hypothetical protein EJB05_39646 [Eragrostis curvula]